MDTMTDEQRRDWQDQFTMCGQFQWHRGECDCGETEQRRADELVARHREGRER